ncbi:MAG: methyltransferase [Alphaproteobacteria bacterium]|nr:methyltransferase [Alphaproteobacteria bacterium]
MDTSIDNFLNGKVRLIQDKNGYRATSDSVLLASAVRAKSGDSILDVGTGTGVILYCLNARIPHLKLTGIEKQTELYQHACQNAELNDCSPTFICEDITTPSSTIHGQQFHHVVTNPPYYTENLLRENKQTAQAYHQIIDLSYWISYCLKHLRAKGTFTIIHRTEALPEILNILSKSALGAIEVIPIFSKEGKPCKRIIVRGIMGSKKPFVLHSGLIIHRKDNTRTEIAEKIMRNGEQLE